MKTKPVILVVDDQHINIELLEAYLAPQGYALIKAASGKDALEKLSGNQIDLVLLDVMMPEMSGFEVLKKLLANKKTCLIPVVMITALKETDDRVKAFEAGCDDFISKPFDKYELLARVKSLIRIKSLHDEVSLARIKELREELLHVTRVGKLAEFVSSLAHEISQPLTAILCYAQAAQRMLEGREPELKQILSYIIDDDDRAVKITLRLRSLLKKTSPEMKPIDINALIDETVLLIATDATLKNVLLKLELESDLPLVCGDRIQLQQVLLNLISNSFDAMQSNRGSREILIRTSRKDDDTIMVSVKDCGCGISKKNMPKLFTHFFTSKPDGLGMGLSISRSIIETHGGQLNAENNSERGATFTFIMPIDKKAV